MYERTLHENCPSPIMDGKPLQGTWTAPFARVNLLDIKRPFSFPVPVVLRNYRIKEWESFIVQNGEVYFEAFLANLKFYSLAEVFFFDKASGEMMRFFKMIPFGSSWRMPQTLLNDLVESRMFGFSFRFRPVLETGTVELDLAIEANFQRPSFRARLCYNFDTAFVTPLVASLIFSGDRSMYTFKNLGSVEGEIVFGERTFVFKPMRTLGLFRDCRGFYPYRMRALWGAGFGIDDTVGSYGFSVAENQARETNKDNENALWVNGELTLLPPVRITQSDDSGDEWMIEDLEGMVDLTFTTKKHVYSSFDIFLTEARYFTPVGLYNGMLRDKNGRNIAVRSLWGMVEKLYLRV